MRLLKWIGGVTGAAGIVGIAAGVIIGVPAVDKIDHVFSTNQFCTESCHVMKDTVAKEFKTSVHGSSHLGVIPKCADCHVSKPIVSAMIDHAKGMNDLYSYVVLGIDTPEEFEKIRFKAADKARMRFVETDSANCRNCHVMEKIIPTKRRGQRQHAEAREKNITCIVCHYNLVHKEVELSKEFDAIVGSY